MKSVIIFDDFYPDPDKIRNIALNCKYDEEAGNWPGFNSQNRYFENWQANFFEWFTGEKVVPSPGSACGMFRVTYEDSPYKQLIHFDPRDKQVWAGVCYLSLPSSYTNTDGSIKDAGTKFWKHKEFGFEKVPMSQEEGKKYGFNSIKDLKLFLETDGMDENKWHLLDNISIKYNRLVLFRPWLWHSIAGQFGKTKEDARLTQLYFFDIL